MSKSRPKTYPQTPAPDASPAPASALLPKGKLGILVSLLGRPQGARIEELTAATGWQTHSVRGAISGAIKKKLGREVLSEKTQEGRVYRITAEVGAGTTAPQWSKKSGRLAVSTWRAYERRGG